MSILINEFLNGEDFICREERQFSLYLYNVLANSKKVKIDLENFANKNYEVAQAYYEASFMRDYFNDADSKADFNLKLLAFAGKKIKELYACAGMDGAVVESIDINTVQSDNVYDINMEIDTESLPFDVAKHINGWSGKEKEYRNPIAKWMMNVKPDIAILLKRRGVKKEDYRLHFIECKYTSGMDVYPALVGIKGTDGKVTECRKITCNQLFVQALILEFICNELELSMRCYNTEPDKNGEIVEKNVLIEVGFVSAAQLVSARNIDKIDVAGNDEAHISISKLYDYNTNMMSEDKKVKEPKVVLGKNLMVNF